MRVTLIRFAYLQEATLGWLFAGALRLATLEEPWFKDPDGPGGQKLEEDKAASCAPDGEYKLVPHNGVAHQNVWAFVNPELGVYRFHTDIPKGQKWGRSAMLLHVGNSTKDIQGCIALGRRHGQERGMPYVHDSKLAVADLRTVLGTGEHSLLIRPSLGTNEVWS